MDDMGRALDLLPAGNPALVRFAAAERMLWSNAATVAAPVAAFTIFTQSG